MSRKLKRLNVGANSEPAVKPYLMIEGETRLVSIDFKALCGTKGTAVSSAAWESDAGVTLSSPTLVSDTASVKFTAETPGIWPVKCVATLANGEKAAKIWRADIRPAKAAALLGEGGSGTNPDGPDSFFSAGEVEFSSPTYEVEIDDESGLITVIRYGGAHGAASVDYATSDGTATAGVDYTAVSGTLSWADGDDDPKTFVVPILSYDDGGTVILTLSDPTVVTIGDVNPALLTIPNEFTITIFDDPGTHEWNPDPRAVSTQVGVLGAGGGGAGGAVEAGATGITGGAGGGGGAGVVATFGPGELVGPITVTVGAGGNGGLGGTSAGTHSGTDGSPGQASSFGALVIAGGGGGGYRGQSSGNPGRSSGGGGGGGAPNTGATGTSIAGGAGGTTGGGAGGVSGAGGSPSTDGGGGGGAGGSASAAASGATSVQGGVGGGSGGAGLNGAAMQPGGAGTLSTATALNDIPQGGAVVQNGPVFGHGEPGENPSDPLMLAGSSGAGGGGSPSNVDGFNTGRGGAGGNGGRGSGGGGGGSAFSSNGSGGAGGTGGNGYVVIIETNA